MNLVTLLVIVLIVGVVASLPRWGHSQGWGYGPSGGLGLVALVLILLLLTGRL